MTIKHLLKKDTYFDSVTLMLINNEVKKLDGVTNAVVGMATDYNVESLKRLELFVPELQSATPNDLVICVAAASDAQAADAVARAEKMLSEKKKAGKASDYVPPTQAAAARIMPDANVVVISVPGRFAAHESRRALDAGRHVMLFSDNVTIEEELELKRKAVAKGLLLMGPDCGTSILNGVPLAFANAVRRGDIGLVAASGTGLQEVTSIIHTLGGGISQAIGVGGRDLSEKIGGLMTIQGVQALADDPDTRVIVLVSKPPHDSTFRKLLDVLKEIKKPIVIYFIGADRSAIEKAGFTAAENLEDAARKAVKAATGKDIPALVSDAEIERRANGVRLKGACLRALYSGGTLCDEAQRLLIADLPELHSNTPVAGAKKMADIYKSEKHVIMDLGDDEFTRGRAHPMIDPAYRQERLVAEVQDPTTGLIAFDVVLGWGSNPDMAGEMRSAIEKAKKLRDDVVYAACICGTDQDFQGYERQQKTLEEIGVAVFPSNVSLVRFIRAVMKVKNEK